MTGRGYYNCLKTRSDLFEILRSDVKGDWIPFFKGMTEGETLGF